MQIFYKQALEYLDTYLCKARTSWKNPVMRNHATGVTGPVREDMKNRGRKEKETSYKDASASKVQLNEKWVKAILLGNFVVV